jgi:hypothetical protein
VAEPWVEEVARRTRAVHDSLLDRLAALQGAAGHDSPEAQAFNEAHDQSLDLVMGMMLDLLSSAADLADLASPAIGDDDTDADTDADTDTARTSSATS